MGSNLIRKFMKCINDNNEALKGKNICGKCYSREVRACLQAIQKTIVSRQSRGYVREGQYEKVGFDGYHEPNYRRESDINK